MNESQVFTNSALYLINKIWKCHVAYVANKLAKSIDILYKMMYILKREMVQVFYSAFVTPHITYCNMAWGWTYKTSSNSVIILQKNKVKLALGLLFHTPSNQIFHNANILSFGDINFLQVSMLMYKFHNILPAYLKTFLSIIKIYINIITQFI